MEKFPLLLDTVSMKLIGIFVLEQLEQLLLSYMKPHKEVCSSTISGWIMKVLNLAGIGTSVFKEHSSRTAASSRAELAGTSVSNILSMGS